MGIDVAPQPDERENAKQVESEKSKPTFVTDEDKEAYDRWSDDGGNNLD